MVQEPTPEPKDVGVEDVMLLQQVEPPLDAEQRMVVQQQEITLRTHTKAGDLDGTTQELSLEIKKRRFARLDEYAKKQGWDIEIPPVQAAYDPELKLWWEEWRILKIELESPAAE